MNKLVSIIIISIAPLLGSGQTEERKRLIKEANRGNPKAMYELASDYFNPELKNANPKETFNWCLKCCNSGDYSSPNNLLATMYMEGYGTEKDTVKAFIYFKKAALKGHSFAQYKLASYYEHSYGNIKEQPDSAFYWVKKSAVQGVQWSQLTVGKYYFRGYGIEKSMDLGIMWVELAANQELVEAYYVLGHLYYFNKDVEQDKKKSAKYIHKALQAGHLEAKRMWEELKLKQYLH